MNKHLIHFLILFLSISSGILPKRKYLFLVIPILPFMGMLSLPVMRVGMVFVCNPYGQFR
jgi:hypothetical protein|nr:MAG TPA: hypothetical protein [Caudoviricetes sp.]